MTSSSRKLTKMQERAADIVRSYGGDEEAIAAAMRLSVSSTPMPKEAMNDDISTVMRATLRPGRSGHHMHEIMFDLIVSGGYRLNAIHKAGMLRACWQNSKFANPVMPDPADTDPHEYYMIGERVSRIIRPKCLGGPQDLMVNDEYAETADLDFWNALPETIVVWRGCIGVDAKTCASGLGWSTNQEVAQFFAHRLWRSSPPVVVRAEVKKSDVITAFAYEHEVVVRVHDFEEVAPRGPKRGGCNTPYEPVWSGGAWDGETPMIAHQSEAIGFDLST